MTITMNFSGLVRLRSSVTQCECTRRYPACSPMKSFTLAPDGVGCRLDHAGYIQSTVAMAPASVNVGAVLYATSRERRLVLTLGALPSFNNLERIIVNAV